MDPKYKNPSNVTNYLFNVGNRISKGKLDLIAETKSLFNKDSEMLTHPTEGELLKMLVQLTNSKKGLEIGVFTGYSGLCLAEGLPEDGILYALDISEDFTNLAKKHWKLNNVDHKINLILGSAIDTLKELKEKEGLESFDFCYIDAEKDNYINYYEIVLKLLKPNGFIVFDNTLWSYAVADESKTDKLTVALRNLNKMLHDDSRVSINMINIADGVTIVRKI